MHKIFAKPVFLGKKVVFLPECHSTNDELARLCKEGTVQEGLVVFTHHQTKGRGQRGNTWEALPGENVLFSMLLRPKKLLPREQYVLNIICGLAVKDLLEKKMQEQEIKLKWPNDVYVGGKKIAGILIECTIKGSLTDFCIVGIGLNLNQQLFSMSTATSVRLETGEKIDVFEFIDEMVESLEHWYLKLLNGKIEDILSHYYDALFWINELHTFKKSELYFKGMITGITENGFLKINTEEGEQVFDVKEVQFID